MLCGFFYFYRARISFGACLHAITLCGVVSACATTSLSLDSSPAKAKVVVKPLGAGATKVLGETPLTVRAADIESEYSGSGPITIEFIKEGYKPKTVLITELSAMNINLKVDLETLSGLDDPALLNAQIESLFEAQRLVRVRRFDEALKLINGIKQATPNLSATYELEGGINYMTARYRQALDAYRQAVKLNPRSVEAVRMRDLLAKNLGATERKPAATEAKR